MKKMQAAVLRKMQETLSIETLELPVLKNGQILIELSYSGVCKSQIMEIDGKRGDDKWLPHLLGHEGSGYVKEVSPNISKVKVGDRVAISWLVSEGCDSCSPKYKSKNFFDTVNSGKSTTFSEFTIVPENRVFKIPENISTLEAVLFGCAIPTGAGMVLNEHRPKSRDQILIYGLGGIGISALITTIALGFKNISVADISKTKLQIAKELGIKETYDLSDGDSLKKIIKKKFDIIYEAAGTVEGIENCFSFLKDTGTLVFASHPETGKKISLDPHELIKGKNIKGSWGGGANPEKIIQKFSELKYNQNIDLSIFLQNIYPFDQINKAINDLKSGLVLRPIIKFKNES